MKKMNILLVAFTLALTAITPMASFAETKEEGETNVSATYPNSYQITIPDSTTELTEKSTFELSANTYLDYGTGIKVSVSSEHGWNLVDTKNGDKNQLSYRLQSGSTVLEGENPEVYTFHNNENKGETITLTVASLAHATYAGTYADILTFTSETVPVEETTPPPTTESTTDAT